MSKPKLSSPLVRYVTQEDFDALMIENANLKEAHRVAMESAHALNERLQAALDRLNARAPLARKPKEGKGHERL